MNLFIMNAQLGVARLLWFRINIYKSKEFIGKVALEGASTVVQWWQESSSASGGQPKTMP